MPGILSSRSISRDPHEYEPDAHGQRQNREPKLQHKCFITEELTTEVKTEYVKTQITQQDHQQDSEQPIRSTRPLAETFDDQRPEIHPQANTQIERQSEKSTFKRGDKPVLHFDLLFEGKSTSRFRATNHCPTFPCSCLYGWT
jgi:hypothetical protein